MLVKWNEPYQKLASCDSSGIIFVWIKYEGRWSIELINDRNTPVTHFSWSHDGRMALICYQVRFGFFLSHFWCFLSHTIIDCSAFKPFKKQKKNSYAGWFRIGWLGSWPTLLVIDVKFRFNYNLWYLDPGRSAGLFWYNTWPNHCHGCSRGNGITSSIIC